MQPFELVITFLIADIATLPMSQTSMPILYSLIPLTALVILHFVVSLLSRKSIVMRKVINGKPVLVVTPNGVQFDALKELNMSIDDLMEGIRSCDYFSIEDVLYAIVETNGSISVIPKKSSANVTNEDLKLELPETTLPLMLITAGKMVGGNLETAKIEPRFVLDILSKAGIENIDDVLLLTIDVNGEVYIQMFNGETKNLQVDFKGSW
ncbi:MAG: DUF421 domain-containing protein [Clostridia bacterium]|nr:DUF421 domain-containing protein [Clostridia bacterium]